MTSLLLRRGMSNGVDLHSSSESLDSLRIPDHTTNTGQRKEANWYAQILACAPYAIALISLILGGSCGFVFMFHDLPDFSDPTAGFEARGTAISGGVRTMNLLYYHDTGYSFYPNLSLVQKTFNLTYFPSPGSNSHGRLRRSATTPSNQTCAEQQIEIDDRIKIVFDSSDGSDLYNARSMRAICEMENKYVTNILEMECHSHSLPFYIATLHNKCCQELREEDMRRFRERLDLCVPYYLNQSLTESCGSGDTCLYVPDDCIKYDAIYKVLHYMTDTDFYPNHTDIKNTNSNITYNPLTYTMMVFTTDPPGMSTMDYYKKVFDHQHLDNGIIKVVGFYKTNNDKFDLFDEDMFSDMRYFGLAGVLILVMLLMYLRSFWLMVATLINIVLSGIAAFFTYSIIMQVHFFPFMNVLGILILIAVGADDVFIFYDTWQQVNSTDREKPLAYRIEKTFKHAALSIFVTSLTTGAAFFSNMVSSISAIRCFGLFAGLAVLANFAFMMTWTPSIIIMLDYIWRWFKNHSKFECRILQRANHITQKTSELIFSQIFPLLVEKLWYVWVIIGLTGGTLGAVAVFWKPGLQLPKSSQFQLFPETNLMENFDQNLAERFASHDVSEKMSILFVWGFTGEDVADKLDPNDDGKVTLDVNFNFTKPESQIWLQNFCDDVRQQEFIDSGSRQQSFKCFLERYEMNMKALCASTQPNSFELCCHNTTPPFEPRVFEKCLPLALVDPNALDSVIYDEANQPVGYAIELYTSQPYSTNYGIMDKLYKEIDNYLNTQLKNAPVGTDKAFITGRGYFHLYDLQCGLSSGTFRSIALSLAVAFVTMFLTSLNLLITVYALITISLAIVVTIGCIVMMGWSLGLLESVTISLAVGLSIDFTIHYGVAYRLSQENTQVKRVYESFARVGSAVAMAALTTFTAGASVMPSSILAYTKLGIFLMLVMTFSWWYATFFFMSVCRILGPRTTFCQISFPCWRTSTSSRSEIDLDRDPDAAIDDNLLYDHQVWDTDDVSLLPA